MSKSERYILTSILTLVALLSVSFRVSAAGDTADKILTDAAAKISKSSGLTASFSMTAGGHAISGSVKSSGKKFALLSNAASSWYDGKSLYTYNSASGETTIVKPSASELAESNPLSIIASAPQQFSASFAKKQTAGCSTLVLTPKGKGQGIKRAVLVVNSAKVPSKLDITTDNGDRIVVTISNVKYGVSLPASTFVYPKSKYPKAVINDLR